MKRGRVSTFDKAKVRVDAVCGTAVLLRDDLIVLPSILTGERNCRVPHRSGGKPLHVMSCDVVGLKPPDHRGVPGDHTAVWGCCGDGWGGSLLAGHHLSSRSSIIAKTEQKAKVTKRTSVPPFMWWGLRKPATNTTHFSLLTPALSGPQSPFCF